MTAPIAQYLFNDNTNDETGTYNGTAYNLTYENAPYGLPFLGKVSLYNGSTSYIDLPVLSSSNTEARTIIFNVYQNNVSANQCYFSAGWGAENGRGLRIGYSSDYYLTVWQDLNNFGNLGLKAVVMSREEWHQIGVSWQLGTNNAKIYLDGVFVGQYTPSAADITGEAFGIGRERASNVFYANAKKTTCATTMKSKIVLFLLLLLLPNFLKPTILNIIAAQESAAQ